MRKVESKHSVMSNARITCCLIVLIVQGCVLFNIHEQFTIDLEQAQCRKHEDVWTVATWITEATGLIPNVCRRVQDVIIHVEVEHVAILLVDIDMPMRDWWHLNDVMMATDHEVLLLSWRDIEQLENPYYEDQLRKKLSRNPVGNWRDFTGRSICLN